MAGRIRSQSNHFGRCRGAAAAILLSLPGLLPGCASQNGQDDDADSSVERLERGRIAMTRFHCGACHVIPGVPGRGRLGPSLEHFGRRSYIAGHIPNERAALERWISEPSAMVRGTLMPDMGVPSSTAGDIAAYLLAQR